MNLNGNQWTTSPQVISSLPPIHDLAHIAVMDFLGHATSCIVYSTPYSDQPLWYIDLMKNKKPHLLYHYENSCGLEVSLHYKPSTYYYLKDKAEGNDWITTLPFPVYCIDKVVTEDKIRETLFTKTYTYRHGYYDQEEREFRGFARVEFRDTETFADFKVNDSNNVVDEILHQEPVRTVSWHHTGAYVKHLKILNQCESEYFQNSQFTEYNNPEPHFDWSPDPEEAREAHRAFKGMTIRTEVYTDDGTEKEAFPYTVSQSAVTIKRIQPSEMNPYAVFQVIPAESMSYVYDRNPADPRISHSVTLEADELGNILKSAAIRYPRVQRPVAPNAIPDEVWDEQNKLHITYMEADFTNDIDTESIYRLRLACERRSYEISGIGQPPEFYLDKAQLKTDILGASEILFEDDFGVGIQKRRSSHTRAYFINDTLDGALPLGQLSKLGMAFKTYSMAMTKDLVTKLYGAKVTNAMLTDAKYVHSEGDEHWWIPSGDVVYAANPKANFYIPVKTVDLFGHESSVSYDKYHFLPESATNAIGNSVSAKNDYRTLSPYEMTDANLNRVAVQTDELGLATATAIMGKVGDSDGDTLTDPTARMTYDLHRWANHQKPNVVHTWAREQHGAANPRWQEGYAYSDGSGNVIMTKLQVEPGEARRWNEATGTVETVQADPRWIGNGRTIVNNKGTAVKSYEPYFSTTHEFEDEQALVKTGVSATMYYDAAGRLIKTEHSDKTFNTIEFDAWYSKGFDVHDTVMDSDWYVERGSPDPSGPVPVDSNGRAAWLSAQHHNTPVIIHTDALGRPFYSITDYGGGKTVVVRSEADLVRRYSKSYDQLGRLVAESKTDMLGSAAYGSSAEKGEKWTFNDAMSRLVKIWDGSNVELRSTYDALHRPVSSYVRIGTQETLTNHVVYGDILPNAEQKNMKGQVLHSFDQSGMTSITEIDFKGQALKTERRLTKAYKTIVDWAPLAGLNTEAAILNAANPLLETEVFASDTEMDALGRVLNATLPDATRMRMTYTIANTLKTLEIQPKGTGSFISFIGKQAYNAKGQRLFAEFGNGLTTDFTYDDITNRLISILTKVKGSADSTALQNLNYIFDAAGNIVECSDTAQQTHYFKNAVVAPLRTFEYDAIGRLIKATGREHASNGAAASQPTHSEIPALQQIPHINNLNAVRNYTEEYEYDDIGNISKITHLAANGNWTRHYNYQYQNDPADRTNRLTTTSAPGDPPAGPYTDAYTYDQHGNMTSMPHLNALIWNYKDQLKEVDLGGGGKAYYVYNAGGQRTRKVIERPGGKRLERIYLGAVEIYREHQGSQKELERQTLHVSDTTNTIARIDTKTFDPQNSDLDNPLNSNLIRYIYGDHLGSATLETDTGGNAISYEEYHPYGTSAYRNAKSQNDLSLKRYRFSGKERDDETGLDYFGARYYAAWLGRWTSTDPAGFVSGFNLYKYCSNNPVMRHDPDGMDDVVVRHDDLGRNASWDTIQQHIPEGYRIREGINSQNYRSHWRASGQYWDILEAIPETPAAAPAPDPIDTPSPDATGSARVGETIVRQNPEGAILEVGENFATDAEKMSDYRNAIQNERNVGINPDTTAQQRAQRRAGGTANREFKGPRNANRPAGNLAPSGAWDADHRIEIQHDLSGQAGTRVEDYRWQDRSLNRSQGSGNMHRKRWMLNRGVEAGVPVGTVAPTSELNQFRHSELFRRGARGLGYGMMAAGPAMGFYSAYTSDNTFVQITGGGLSAIEGAGGGIYAYGRIVQGGGAGGTAQGLRTMALGSNVARFAGGGAGIVLSGYSGYVNVQNGNYGALPADAGGMYSSVAVLAGSGPHAAIGLGVVATNMTGDYVESVVTPHAGREVGVAAGTAAGAAAGAAIGAAIGVWGFGVGAAPAAAVGAVVGGIAGFIGAYW